MIGRLHYASRGTALGRGNRDAARLLGTEPAPATSVAGFRAALAQTIGSAEHPEVTTKSLEGAASWRRDS
jgi:hypothetical protein